MIFQRVGISQNGCLAGQRPAHPAIPLLNVWTVISGGQLKRTSTDEVPAPRDV